MVSQVAKSTEIDNLTAAEILKLALKVSSNK
jgi:hypothetical protein